MNEYIFEKTGLTVELQNYTHKMKSFFSFDSCGLTPEGIKFENVCLKEDITYQGNSLKNGDVFKSLEVRKNGNLHICENDTEKFTIINHSLKEEFALPELPSSEIGGYEKFPSVNAIQMGAMTDIQKVIASVKKLSLEDANYLKSIMGPSLEEKILRTIVDAVLFDTPPANGLQNGV